MQNAEFAVDEIERCAADRRFVQVLMLAMHEVPLGRRHYWPIYAAAERHGLPIGIHAGRAYRHPVTSLGWPTYYIEDYAGQSQGFQSQVASLICEGVFAKFPELKVVLIESGVTWLPAFLWRLRQVLARPAHRGAVGRPLARRDRARPCPPDHPAVRRAGRCPTMVERVIEHLRSDEMLLFSSDYPHWQFDGDEVMPAGLSARRCAARSWSTIRSRPTSALQGDRAMNIERQRLAAHAARRKLGIVDCDIHPQRSRIERAEALS